MSHASVRWKYSKTYYSFWFQLTCDNTYSSQGRLSVAPRKETKERRQVENLEAEDGGEKRDDDSEDAGFGRQNITIPKKTTPQREGSQWALDSV